MTRTEDGKKHHHFDVERFLKIHAETRNAQTGVWRILRKITRRLDSAQGILIPFVFLLVAFGTFFAVLIGVMYGPIAFAVVFGSILGGIGYYGEKKVGRSLQFGDYNLLKRMIVLPLAFMLVLGALLLLVFIARHGVL